MGGSAVVYFGIFKSVAIFILFIIVIIALFSVNGKPSKTFRIRKVDDSDLKISTLIFRASIIILVFFLILYLLSCTYGPGHITCPLINL